MSLVLCGAVMLLDGYDLTAMPLAVPHLGPLLGLAPQGFALALSAVLLGLGLGAVTLAPLGDRFGRRRVILAALPVLAAATFGTASGRTLEAFAAWRLLTGLALGACLPNVTALSAELARPGRRASTMSVVSMAIPLGAAGAGLIVPPLVALAGWAAIFLLAGIVTLVLFVALWLGLAEAPQMASTASQNTRIAALWLALLAPSVRRVTGLICALYALNAGVLYYVNSWVPTVLPWAGFPLASAAHAVALLQIGGMAIALVLARLLDAGRGIAVLAASYAVIAAALLAFGLIAPTRLGWGALLLLAGGGVAGVHVAILALASQWVAPRLLSSLIGMAVALARIGAIGGPLLGGLVVARVPAEPAGASAFFALAAVPVAACLGLVLLLRRTAPRRPAQGNSVEP
ncbi:MFS transporter [Novosphingobium sp. 1949]|uniref:MFS transporter n=1 Tax=Novosphingobium organovorum TaxID=2930092 RepID=A0ABT0B9V1_9SPHN|nr:MFS transporter [Novosphingobium organovorum]MCJ2181798.1 MFS transporter [Novosphingobium organovorum]